MNLRRGRHLRVVGGGDAPDHVITSRGRPSERRGVQWMVLAVRILTLGWSGAVIAALLDTFGSVPHLPFVTAMGMTGLLVATMFLMTRDGVPDWRGDVIPAKRDDDDYTNDLLTNLPTFNHFQRRLGDEFTRSRRMGKLVSVVLIDVNNLTAVNKEYGVRAGDEVLRHVARAIDDTKRYNDVVSRLGDDEFGVLLLDCGDEGVRAFIDRLEDRLARESAMAEVSGRMISLWAGVCSGSAVSEPQLMTPEAVLEGAMANLNVAKQERERRRRTWLSA